MNYEIQSRNDFLTGSYLVAKIPESELDQNALMTIQAECPDFILPFHYKSADEQVELVYKVGALCKLQYFSGNLTAKEYAELWKSLLKPLLACADWFMNPCSFILNTDYLYYDKIKKAIRYVYIPSAYGCSGHDAFYDMAVEVSKMMSVSDTVLENKVLRAIIKDFNPIEFLQMLNDYAAESLEAADTPLAREESAGESDDERNVNNRKEASYTSDIEVMKVNEAFASEQDFTDDILIDTASKRNKKERDAGRYRLFGSRGKKKKEILEKYTDEAVSDAQFESEAAYKTKLASRANKHYEKTDVTQSVSVTSAGPGLRLIGRANLPPSIKVLITEGEIFTIGRYDAAVGKKQSNFEFDKKTKAICRRHAVIERSLSGYNIIDLSSSAGTFVNDKKVPPNTPVSLESGSRVSFGNSGADYIWDA